MAEVSEGSNRGAKGGADRRIPEFLGDDRLPWVARFVLFLLVLLLAAFMIGLPVWSVQRYGATTGIDLWGPVVAMLLGLTTMTISGIFVFMTFRIDRGTKLRAEWTAKEIAKKTVEEVVQKVMGQRIAEAQGAIKNEFDTAKRKVVEIDDDLARAKSDIDGHFQGAADTMRTIADKVADAETEISGQFDALQETVKGKFAEVVEQMEKANIDELIRRHVEIHMSTREENDGGTGGEDGEDGSRKEE